MVQTTVPFVSATLRSAIVHKDRSKLNWESMRNTNGSLLIALQHENLSHLGVQACCRLVYGQNGRICSTLYCTATDRRFFCTELIPLVRPAHHHIFGAPLFQHLREKQTFTSTFLWSNLSINYLMNT